MRSFTYGSRVIENEQQVRLHMNVKKIGNLLHTVVSFSATFFLFVFINVLLSNLVQHTNFTFFTAMRLVQESVEVLFSTNALSFITFFYEHAFCIMLALAFTCVYQFAFVLKSLVDSESNSDKEKETYSNCTHDRYVQLNDSTISYRHKVCFLS